MDTLRYTLHVARADDVPMMQALLQGENARSLPWRGSLRWVIAKEIAMGNVVAMCTMHEQGTVSRCVTHLDHRRRGLMRALLENQIAHAYVTNVEYLQLSLRAENAGAIALYRSLGFTFRRDEGNGIHVYNRDLLEYK